MGDSSTLRTPRRALWAWVGIAALVRLTYWASKWDDALRLNDSLYYSGQARLISQGVWFREVFSDHPGAEHGPLTSLLMAPVSLGAEYHRWQRLVTVATGIALVWVLGRFVEDLAGRRAGAIAAAIAALYPNLWMNDGLVMSESVSMLLVGAVLWAAWRAAHDAAPVRWAVLGVVLGLAVLARSELVLLAPLVVGWLLVARRRGGLEWRPALFALVVAVAVVAPWVSWNLVRFERPVLLTTNDGTTLFGANCPLTYGGEQLGGWTLLCLPFDAAYSPDEEPSVRSARQRRIGVDYALDHVADWPEVVAARVGRSLDLYAVRDSIHQDVGEERPRWAAWTGVVWFWVLAAVSVFGARRLSRRAWTLVALPIAVALVTTVLFYGAHRVRSTAEPSLVVFAAVAVNGWWSRARRMEVDP